jgi:hypothetical protein
MRAKGKGRQMVGVTGKTELSSHFSPVTPYVN